MAEELGADDGSAAPAVVDVLLRRAAGLAAVRGVVACVAQHRLLVPLVRVSADQLEVGAADPCAGQDSAMAAVSMRAADGTTVGLAFTGLSAMATWDATARPMPVTADRAAQAVLAGGGRTMVIDPGSPTMCRIEGLALVRLARATQWPEPWEDDLVREAVLAELAPAMAEGLRVRLCAPDARSGADLAVHVRFPADLSEEVSGRRAALVARRLGGSDLVRAVFEGTIAVSAGSGQGQATGPVSFSPGP